MSFNDRAGMSVHGCISKESHADPDRRHFQQRRIRPGHRSDGGLRRSGNALPHRQQQQFVRQRALHCQGDRSRSGSCADPALARKAQDQIVRRAFRGRASGGGLKPAATGPFRRVQAGLPPPNTASSITLKKQSTSVKPMSRSQLALPSRAGARMLACLVGARGRSRAATSSRRVDSPRLDCSWATKVESTISSSDNASHPRRRRGDVLDVDEHAARRQQREDLVVQRPLARVGQVVDRVARGDDVERRARRARRSTQAGSARSATDEAPAAADRRPSAVRAAASIGSEKSTSTACASGQRARMAPPPPRRCRNRDRRCAAPAGRRAAMTRSMTAI